MPPTTSSTTKHPLDQTACVCGRNVDECGRQNTILTRGNTLYAQEPLDTSFVHLPSPVPPTMMSMGMGSRPLLHPSITSGYPDATLGKEMGDMGVDDVMAYNQGFVASHQHLVNLWNMMERISMNDDNNDNNHHDSSDNDAGLDVDHGDGIVGEGKDIPLCLDYDSVKTIAYSLEDNTQRLKEETAAYVEAVRQNETAQKRFNKALTINMEIQKADDSPTSDGSVDNHTSTTITEHEYTTADVVQNTIDFLSQEIETLETYCCQHEQEVEELDHLLSEQMLISDAQTLEEHELLLEYNALEVDANAFQQVHRQLSSQLYLADQEVLALSHTSLLLHSGLFDITLDDRGLRYPLINNLRLAHRPKGDVEWNEISAAWGQISQLIMFVGSAIQFTSPNFRIVPLTSSCAKIIDIMGESSPTSSSDQRKHERVVYNLGYDGSMTSSSKRSSSMVQSLRILNQLVEQIVNHLGQAPPSTQPHDLRQLHETNDVAWSCVINSMASNLKWLSGVATG